MADFFKSTTKDTNRNFCLSFFESLACIFVIFMHCQFPEDFGVKVIGIARFGVPLFFVVSGYYLIKDGFTVEQLREKLKVRLYRISILTLFSFLVYFAENMYMHRDGIISWLTGTFCLKNILLFVILNNPFLSGPNWFLLALLYSYIIIYIFAGAFLNKRAVSFLLSLALILVMIIRLMLYNYHSNIVLLGYPIWNGIFYRTWFANGLLFISLGITLSRNRELLKKVNTGVIIFVLISSFILMTVEYCGSVKQRDELCYYFFNIICVISIIALSEKMPGLFSNAPLAKNKGNWTMYVYIFHPAMITVVGHFLKTLGINEHGIVLWIKPIIVAILSVVFAIAFNYLILALKSKRKIKATIK